jgi:hypothetical protein
MSQNRLSPKEVIITFKTVLEEAARIYNKRKQDVNQYEFAVVGNGRLGVRSMAKCGGYTALKAFITSPGKKENKQLVMLVNKLNET